MIAFADDKRFGLFLKARRETEKSTVMDRKQEAPSNVYLY
jgi:hypothetical protein